jgi:hypothetical protein
MLPGKGQDDQERERPAQEGERHRRDVAGGQPPDNGVAGPAQRRDAEQQIRLVGEPVPDRADEVCSEAVEQFESDRPGSTSPRRAPPAEARRAGMWPGPCHRHGFARLINGAGCIATMQPALFLCSLPVVWGCQRAANMQSKDELIHRSNLGFAFWGRMRFFRVIFEYRAVRSLGPRFAGGCIQELPVREVEFQR